jgi:hypothetical protein
MSFDLLLYPEVWDPRAIAAYFASRPNYGGEGERAFYQNADTGVYFSFDIMTPAGEGDPDAPELNAPHIAFNLNYYRPHIFGLEAEPEVMALVSTFKCRIHDPQNNGMANGPYSREGFLRSWNTGNAFGFEAIGARDDGKVMRVPGARIEQVWKWNLARNDRQADHNAHDRDMFTPRLSWARDPVSREPVLYCVWGEGVQGEFPALATHILLARDARRPKGFLQSLLRKPEAKSAEYRLMRLDDVAQLDGVAWMDDRGDRLLRTPAAARSSAAVRALFDGPFDGLDGRLEPLATDAVLNAELFPAAT